MSSRPLFSLYFFLALGLVTPPAQGQYPTQWHVNGNGYVGLLIYTVDPATFKVQGTLLGTPCEGMMVGRRLILHRTPRGSQIWEGWIMDARLGAQGQPYYRGEYFIAGTISEEKAGNSLYPWYGVPTSAGPPPWNSGAGGGQFTGVGGQIGGGGQPGIGGGQSGFTGGGQPGIGSGQPGIGSGQPGVGSGQPGVGSGQPGVPGGNLVVNGSFEQGPAVGSFLTLAAGAGTLPGWTVTKGTVDISGTYLVAGDGARSIDLIGTPGAGGIRQIINTVPGQSYLLSFYVAGNCSGGEKVKQMRVVAGSANKILSFDTTGHTNQQPGWVRQELTFQANSARTALEFSDPGPPGTGVRYGMALDNVAVVPAATGGQVGAGGSGSLTLPPPTSAGGGSGNWALNPGGWTPAQSGVGKCLQAGGQLCIESKGAGGAYFTMRRQYSVERDYTVSFEAKLNATDNHWVVLYSDGFVFLNIDWGTDFKHTQGSGGLGAAGRLEASRWYTIRADAHPGKGTFDVYLDGAKVSSAQGIKFPLLHHDLAGPPALSPDVIFIGDNDGGAYNHGSVCWRNIRVSTQGGGVQVSGSDLPNVGSTGGGVTPGGGNLVVNGSFEQGPPVDSFLTLAAGAETLPGWTVTKGTVDISGTYLVAGDGSRSIDLIGTPGAGGIRQVVSTVPGQSYRLSFYMAGNCTGGDKVKKMKVGVGSASRILSFDTSGHHNRRPGWVQRGFTFEAISTQTVLEFSDPGEPTSNARYGAALDKVVVVPVVGVK
jgi:choice-of-anchor C domain-containing protein